MRNIKTSRGNWKQLQIIQKILEKHKREARNEGTTENNYTGHCLPTSDSRNVKVQSV
jgi:hypothetical protein